MSRQWKFLSNLFTQGYLWINQFGTGLILTSGLALMAIFIQTLPGMHLFSPLIMTILLGLLIRNIFNVPQICKPGILLSLKKILRLAIILLGLQLSFSELLTVGLEGFFVVVITLISTFYVTCWVGKCLGVKQQLTQLIAAGTAICGASAVVAVNTVVDGSDEDVAYSVAIVTAFGTASMLLYPFLPTLLNLTPESFGIWCGASIHETAQVIAAAFQGGSTSGQVATLTKLARVILLAPTVVMLGVFSLRRSQAGQSFNLRKLPIPWFLIYFVGLVVLNSLNVFPDVVKSVLIDSNKFLLATSMAAMGLETSFARIRQTGLKPLYVGLASWVFISSISLGLVQGITKMFPLVLHQ